MSCITVSILLLTMVAAQEAIERFEDFSADPNWEGKGNRIAEERARTIIQDFGYSCTHYTGGQMQREIGGCILALTDPSDLHHSYSHENAQ